MPTNVIMPALGMAQETGTLIRWLKVEGEQVEKEEPIMEIETDKVTVEIEAPATGILSHVTADAGDVVPVGQTVALILAPGESAPTPKSFHSRATTISDRSSIPASSKPHLANISSSPVATRMMAEHDLNPALVKPDGGQIKKEDVAAYLARRIIPAPRPSLPAASPKARRLAIERNLQLDSIQGSGPNGAVLAADLDTAHHSDSMMPAAIPSTASAAKSEMGNIWRVMAERTTQSWTTVPHFYLMREVSADRLQAWRSIMLNQSSVKVTFTDLLVRLVALSLRRHPRLNAQWVNNSIVENSAVHIGLATGIDEGLVVPVIHDAHTLSVPAIAERRANLVARARDGTLRPEEVTGGTFTISNLGMYGIDSFQAVINPPQAAILAVGRIADRIIPVDGQPVVRPMMVLNLSCDHRVVDGARAAQFLNTLAQLIEEPLTAL